MNDAAHDLMINSGYVFDSMDPSAKGVFAVVSLNADYKASMRLHQAGVVESSVQSVGRSSIVLEHRIMSAGNLMVSAKETRVFVARNAEGVLRSQELSAGLKEALLGNK
jgi:YbgC/YbaW family acyl-CoA thioester hydrolase